MRWTAVVRPILEFLQRPRLAPDAPEARKNLQYVVPLRRDWQRMRDEYYQRLRMGHGTGAFAATGKCPARPALLRLADRAGGC
jgi:hypothetical protein